MLDMVLFINGISRN